MKTQLVFIHGGDVFDTQEKYLSSLKNIMIETLDYFKPRSWGSFIRETLGDDFEVITPQMPNKANARYSEWKIWFEKIIPLLGNDIIFVGHSLGAIFLSKYLSENKIPKKIKGVFLVATPFDGEDTEDDMGDFILPDDLHLLKEQAGELYFYHSKDDSVVPFLDLEKYQKKIPNAHFLVFEDRGHFSQKEFPELIEEIKKL